MVSTKAEAEEEASSEKSVFVTDSRYEIAIKDEVDDNIFDVKTSAEPMKAVLEKLADGGKAPLRVGLDAHLFTQKAVDALGKVDGIELVVNVDAMPLVEVVTASEDGDVGAGEETVYLRHDAKYAGLTHELKLAKIE